MVTWGNLGNIISVGLCIGLFIGFVPGWLAASWALLHLSYTFYNLKQTSNDKKDL